MVKISDELLKRTWRHKKVQSTIEITKLNTKIIDGVK